MRTVLLLFLLALSSQAGAAVCVENNTLKCDALGYDESSCPYGGIACPFDASRWHCATWNCEDGSYYSNQNVANAECVTAEYKGLSCYECACRSGSIDYTTCWSNASVSLNDLLTDATRCRALGYVDTAGSCSNYLVCPADASKIRCLRG